nr:MAG TPA: hypothetical protein [Caudoviricetes sp.]
MKYGLGDFVMRQFVNVSWNNAAEQYDGYQQMNKHMNPNGTAAIHNYSDEALGQTKPKKSSVPLKQRILPQAARVERLTTQMIELCAEYKAGLHTLEEYTLLLSVVSAKRARAEELLAKAVSVKAPFELEEDTEHETKYKTSREILSENKRSALKAKEPKPKTENVKHDRKSLSKVADWINRNSFIYFIGCSTIALTAAKIIF